MYMHVRYILAAVVRLVKLIGNYFFAVYYVNYIINRHSKQQS